MTAGWGARAVRAAVFAAVCVLLAALGHVLMSGSSVPAWALTAGAAGTGAASWCLAGRERSLPLIVAAVVAVQTVLHEAFSLTQPASAGPDSMDMGMNMNMGSMPMTSIDMGRMGTSRMSSMGNMGQSMDGGGGSSYGMLAAHLLAALLTGLWLAYGEKAAFRILRAVAGWLAAPLRLLLALPVPPCRPLARPRRPRSDRAPGLLLLVHAITSRGPPVGTAVI
ncbi:hypothetical protein ABZ915_36545 [Streptomyces sp. NPDC046915]|uniref:hypothetical protein n=1 Tax=Streptomyces sp. NPDC046915 TaxID=3155257 RepID=UPI0033E0F36A